MVKPASNSYVTLRDLKTSKVAGSFFNVFINIEKYLMSEKKENTIRVGKVRGHGFNSSIS